MSFTPTKLLKSDPTILLRDQQHAARLFTDDQFRLAPKHSFLFHVAFNINQSALKDIGLLQKHRNEINMLVKSIDLPSFTISSETLNQYNRKKVVQYQHKFNEISIKFHDDNMGVINQLWQNYYSYYYADSAAASSSKAYSRNATKNSNFINSAYGYDNSSSNPFFNYITIYQMARHEYISYKLINPIITNWNHNKLDYANNNVHEFDMKISYESVAYGNGSVTAGAPEGFAIEHYDVSPSPLTGVKDETTASPTFVKTTTNSVSSVDTVTTQLNSYQNTQIKPTSGNKILTNLIQTTVQGVSGLHGIAFPVSTESSATTVAKPINLGNNT